MNFAIKNAAAVLVLGATLSAQAGTLTKAQLLKSCENPETAQKLGAEIVKELKVNLSNDAISSVDKIKSGYQIVYELDKAKFELKGAAIQEGFRQTQDTIAVLSIMKSSMNKAIVKTREKVGANEIMESAIQYGLFPTLDVLSEVYEVSMTVGTAKFKKENLSASQLDQLAERIQSKLEQNAAAKIKMAGLSAKFERLSEKEKESIQKGAQLLGANVQIESCKDIVNYTRK